MVFAQHAYQVWEQVGVRGRGACPGGCLLPPPGQVEAVGQCAAVVRAQYAQLVPAACGGWFRPDVATKPVTGVLRSDCSRRPRPRQDRGRCCGENRTCLRRHRPRPRCSPGTACVRRLLTTAYGMAVTPVLRQGGLTGPWVTSGYGLVLGDASGPRPCGTDRVALGRGWSLGAMWLSLVAGFRLPTLRTSVDAAVRWRSIPPIPRRFPIRSARRRFQERFERGCGSRCRRRRCPVWCAPRGPWRPVLPRWCVRRWS